MNLDHSQIGVGVELGWASPKYTIKYKYHIHISHLIMNTQIWNSTIPDQYFNYNSHYLTLKMGLKFDIIL
jgi:hypothetical protein